MDQIKRIRLEAWVDDSVEQGTQRSACALHVDRHDGCEGLRYVWFVMEEAELHGLGRGTVRMLEDGYHRLNVAFGHVIFYDMEIPQKAAGTMTIPYLRMEIPPTFWRYLERLARVIWKGLRKADIECANERYYYTGRRIEIEIPLETLERFQRTYGQGRGQIERQYSARLQDDMLKRPGLLERVQRVETIALNYSRHRFHTVIASIQNDGDGYYFSTRDHKGRRGMCGGIVNHSKEVGRDDWSIHT